MKVVAESITNNRTTRILTMDTHSTRSTQDDDPDANQRLMQAILDTVDHHARVAGCRTGERARR